MIEVRIVHECAYVYYALTMNLDVHLEKIAHRCRLVVRGVIIIAAELRTDQPQRSSIEGMKLHREPACCDVIVVLFFCFV